ncbi:MAG: hypothetical protein H6550_04225 [Chitinophagales bacterium]|nr:hypothetical protein [Chitinophagales bacterium]
MKNVIAFLLIGSISICATAQETTEITSRRQPGKNEIGIFLTPISTYGNNSNYWGNSEYSGNAGLQYKRWVKPNIAYRIIGALGNYNQNNFFENSEKRGDTLYFRQANTNIPLYFIGGGLEVQRQFYKKVTLYAAVEVRAGYGTGEYEEFLTKMLESQQMSFNPNSYFGVTRVANSRASAFILDATPFIGGKINFRRICIGTEASVVKVGMEQVHFDNLPDYSIFNVALGSFRQRFYINYRF